MTLPYRRTGRAIALALASLLWHGVARGEDPLIVVRAFCIADGAGSRLSPTSWRRRVAPLVAWPLEPAWDRLTLVRGYEIQNPRRVGSRVEVEIRYTVTAEISPGKVVREPGEETVTLSLVEDSTGHWRVAGAPPPPHVFNHVVDPDALAELLQPGTSYESNSAYVWALLREAGWDIPYTLSAEIADSPRFHEAGTAAPGDLVVYYSNGSPYHVGWIEDEDTVLSASLNAGRGSASYFTFAGALRYWRPQLHDDSDAKPSTTPSRRP